MIDGLTLTGGVRRDEHDTFGGKTLGQAAAAWSLNQGATVLRASFGQGFKAPACISFTANTGTPPWPRKRRTPGTLAWNSICSMAV